MKSVNLLFIATALDMTTGGHIYDFSFYRKLRDDKRFEIETVCDNDFEKEYVRVKPSFLRYTFCYKKRRCDFEKNDVQIINSRMYTRFLGRSLCSLPVILIHHHFDFMSESGLKRKIKKWMELRFLNKARFIITPNKYTYDMCKRYGLENKMILVESDTLSNVCQDHVETSEKYFLYLGGISVGKGIMYGLKAFKIIHEKHPEYKFKIAGGTCDVKQNEEYLQEMICYVQQNDLTEAVEFIGWVQGDNKEKLYREAYAFLFPSQNEGYGWVMVEAMKYGLPVVAFNNTAIPYTVNETNGFLIDNKDINQMADAMICLIENKDIYVKLSNGAKRTVEALPDKKIIENEYDIAVEKIISCAGGIQQ